MFLCFNDFLWYNLIAFLLIYLFLKFEISSTNYFVLHAVYLILNYKWKKKILTLLHFAHTVIRNKWRRLFDYRRKFLLPYGTKWNMKQVLHTKLEMVWGWNVDILHKNKKDHTMILDYYMREKNLFCTKNTFCFL